MCENVTRLRDTHPLKVSSVECDLLDLFDSVDDETLMRLIREMGLDVHHELPELKDLQISSEVDELQPER